MAISVCGSAGNPAAAPDLPAVVRAHYQAGNQPRAVGTAFFLSAGNAAGSVAVGAAHSYELGELAAAQTVEFRLARSGQRAARATRFLVAPGSSFHAQGASLRGDFVVFALDDLPYGVRILKGDPRPAPERGERVRILGVPAQIQQDEDDLFGTVSKATPDRLEVDLDTHSDLRGWGGAPVLSESTGQVLGILEATWPVGQIMRVGAAPISAVLQALQRPLAGGQGLPFAEFATAALPAAAATAAAIPPLLHPASDASAIPSDTHANVLTGDDHAALPVPSRIPAAVSSAGHRSLLGQPELNRAQLSVTVEYPQEGAIVSDPNGAFVTGRTLAAQGALRPFDVIFVLDTSHSTSDPAGADINGNGSVGKARLGGVGSLFGLGSSDAGDSILAAEVAAARQLLRSLDPRSTRVGLVTFAGEPQGGGRGIILGSRPLPPSITEEPLGADYARIEHALQRVFARGPRGSTHMAAGVDQATVELLGLRGALSSARPDAEKIVLFFTDGQPTLPYDPVFMADNVRAVLRAAERARRAGIRIHSFALGLEALEGPIATVEMAARTDGYFTPVRNPGDLIDVVEEVRFTDIRELRVRNESTEQEAQNAVLNLDGSFSTLVPLRNGLNRIRVEAYASDGSRADTFVTVSYAPGTPEVPVPPEYVAQRNQLLEQKLLELRHSRLEAEQEAIEETRQELLLEIEKERTQAVERAEQQRKELNLEVEEETAE